MRAPRSRRGLTIMDGVIVVASLALALLTWLPGRRVERVLRAEETAMATLRELAERVDAHRAAARTDRDGDGAGETPSLGEVVSESEGFRPSSHANTWARDGYWFTVLVPGTDRQPRQPSEAVSADLAESTYVLVAWPVEPGSSGMRAYIRTPLDGLLRHAVDGYPYGGPEHPPAPRVALLERRGATLRPVPLKDSKLWVPPRETLDTSTR